MIRHRKIIPVGDSVSAGVVPTPAHWHEPHNAPDWLIWQFSTHDQAPETSTNPLPEELAFTPTIPATRYWTRYDFSYIDQICIEVVSGIEATKLSGEYRAQYSLDEGVTWNAFDGITGPRVDVASSVHYGGTLRGLWVDVAQAAKRDVVLRVVSLKSDGNLIYSSTISVWGR